MKQQQIDAFCTPAGTALGAGTGSAPQLSTGTALRPGRRASIPQISQSQAWKLGENWLGRVPVPSGLLWGPAVWGWAVPMACSSHPAYGSWGYFGFWSNWNTKYEDFSLQPGLSGWLRVKLGWAASALLQPLETWGPSPRSAGVVLGAGARLEEQAATASGGLKTLKTWVKAHWKECLAI